MYLLVADSFRLVEGLENVLAINLHCWKLQLLLQYFCRTCRLSWFQIKTLAWLLEQPFIRQTWDYHLRELSSCSELFKRVLPDLNSVLNLSVCSIAGFIHESEAKAKRICFGCINIICSVNFATWESYLHSFEHYTSCNKDLG